MSPKVATRSAPSIWLIGCSTDRIHGETKLPTLRSVLQLVLHFHKPPSVTLRDACGQAVDKLLPFWTRGGVPTVGKKFAIDKLVKIHSEWVDLKKCRTRPTTEKRDKFISSLDKLFDIGPANAEKIIKIEEDKLFYESMKNDRKASMTSVDRKWAAKQETLMKKRLKRQKQKIRAEEEAKRRFQVTSSESACPEVGDCGIVDPPKRAAASAKEDTGELSP